MIWETTKIEALISEAEEKGEAIITLESHRDAKLFRQAILNRFYAKHEKCPLLTLVSDRTLTLRTRPKLSPKENLMENDPKPEPKPENPNELEIRLTPQAQVQMDKIASKDPNFNSAMKSLFADMHQAWAAWKSGQYPTFESALEALGRKLEPIDEGFNP